MKNAICTKIGTLLDLRGNRKPNVLILCEKTNITYWPHRVKTIRLYIPDKIQPYSKTLPYSSETERRLKMGSRRPSKLGDSVPLEEELREQEDV